MKKQCKIIMLLFTLALSLGNGFPKSLEEILVQEQKLYKKYPNSDIDSAQKSLENYLDIAIDYKKAVLKELTLATEQNGYMNTHKLHLNNESNIYQLCALHD
jgi:hypothetical protein